MLTKLVIPLAAQVEPSNLAGRAIMSEPTVLAGSVKNAKESGRRFVRVTGHDRCS